VSWRCYTASVREFVDDERSLAVQAPTNPIPTGWPVTGKECAVVTYVISQPCIGVKDASCVEVCPVDCIHSTDDAEQYFINPLECIDCGVCAEVCPVEAIFFEDDLPEQWAAFMGTNKDFFEK